MHAGNRYREQGFTLDVHTEFGKLSDDLRRSKAMVVVGLTLENASQMHELELVRNHLGHKTPFADAGSTILIQR